MDLGPGLRAGGGFAALDPSQPATLARIDTRAPDRDRTGTVIVEHYDASLSIDALRAGDLTLSGLVGLRATTADFADQGAGPNRPTPSLDSTPVAGAGLRYRLGRDWSLEGSAVFASPRADTDLLEVGLGSRWRLSTSTDLSIEYRFLRNRFDAEPFSGEVYRESVLIELRIGF